MRDDFLDGLHEWQKQILSVVDTYSDRINSHSVISMSQYDINCNELIQVRMHQSYGHDLLAAVLSAKYDDSLLIYIDTNHLMALDNLNVNWLHCKEQKFNKVSMFEIYYAIIEHNKNSIYLDRIRDKIENSTLVVVANASQVPDMVKDFILSTATSQIVFLN